MLEGSSSAELREKCMRERFLPIATAILARDPSAQSVGYLVGQYWADEAQDAVHEAIVPFAQRDPRWPDDAGADEPGDPDERLDLLFADSGSYFDFVCPLPNLDENGSAITAFAAFCKEECHQDMTLAESHLLYAVARRDGAGVAIEVVGKLLRPEWEDRFDVGLATEEPPGYVPVAPPRGGREPNVVTPSRPAPSSGASRRFGLLAFLRRLFGR